MTSASTNSQKIAVLDRKGKEKKNVTLDPAVFDGSVNKTLLHQAVVTYRANQRFGLAATKNRGEVRGGGKKPWRQKGLGRARVGSIRSPLWTGGGVTFGPQPHSYRKGFPKKMRVNALKSALNAKFADGALLVLNELKIKDGKTKEIAAMLKETGLHNEKVRFVVTDHDEKLKRATRNIPRVELCAAHTLTTYEALNCTRLIITEGALTALQERIKKCLG
ncbi:MAG: 50S ribosomal protein L4 [Candidatus Omnitrophica bacterium]|nr:50S ribosomal protein L4 [Candidatus Omnitrophota bacterium]